MHASQVVAVLALSAGALAGEFEWNGLYCPGTLYNNICCVEGVWTGPVVSSFVNEWSSRANSIASSVISQGSVINSIATNQATSAISRASSEISVANSIATNVATNAINQATSAAGVVTSLFGGIKIPRAPLTQISVSSGLTCNGIATVLINDKNAAKSTIASLTSAASSTYTSTSLAIMTNNGQTLVAAAASVATPTAGAPTSTSSKAGAAMVTRAPLMVAGGAALAFAYGAM
ncbi:hypothetical protein B0J14DRAFT_75234 [Halenospora varia]|nr:hypothetical protein B0J14DRAFT_75234 [Halenospora varia]